MDIPSRNDRCPCGSGKKYKHCCLGKAEPAATEQGRQAHVWNTAGNAVVDQIVAWTRRRFGSRWADEAMTGIAERLSPEAYEAEMLLPWLVYHFPLRGAPPAAQFLAERGDRLSDAERTIVVRHLASWLSLWEVRRVEPGVGVELFDLLTGETRFVHDVRGSQNLERWLAVLCSVVDYPEVSVFGGVHAQSLLPVHAEDLLAKVRRVVRSSSRRVLMARLRAPEMQIGLVVAWQHAVEGQELAAVEPRIVNNTDGDDLIFCTDHFDLAPDSRAQVFARLSAVEGADAEQPDSDEAVVFTRPGIKMQASWKSTILGRAVFSGGRLKAETNSVKRADSIKRTIEQAGGALVRHRARDVRGLEAMLAERAAAPREAHPEPEHTPEVQAFMREMLERHYESWPDEHLPALGGRTPREAAASARLRPRLVSLLKQMEHMEASKPAGERFDFGRLWRALGMDPLEPLPNRQPAGAGSKLRGG